METNKVEFTHFLCLNLVGDQLLKEINERSKDLKEFEIY